MNTWFRKFFTHPAFKITIAAVSGILSLVLSAGLLLILFCGSGCVVTASASVSPRTILDDFDMYITNTTSSALDGVLAIEKIYRLNDADLVAPQPDQTRFGKTADEQELKRILRDASDLLDGQDLLFSPETPRYLGGDVRYYSDRTILALTWKQVIDNSVWTISEVKIADPSQFRRFLADGQYGSDKQYLTTEMASSVNAVVASAGDFYKYRREGIVVYDNEVKRMNIDKVDTCGIDKNGDLIFLRRGMFAGPDEAQTYVDDNGIRFTLAFGPILVENGERCEPQDYQLGEVNGNFSRAALCQMGELHYLLITVNGEGAHYNYPTIHAFAARVAELGCEKAYALDGGQTATIAMNGELINQVNYGSQRQISDIIYFATALQNPDGEEADNAE